MEKFQQQGHAEQRSAHSSVPLPCVESGPAHRSPRMSASQWGGPPAAFSTEGNALPAENGNDDDDELDYPLALMPAEARPAIADGERDATVGEAGPSGSEAAKQKPTPVPRRDKSLSALSHELIARYGNDGTVIDLDQVQVSCHSLVADPRGCARGGTLCAPCAACASHLRRCPSAWASPRRPASW